MIEFTKPKNLNGAELRQELRDAGINISDDVFAVKIFEDLLALDIDEKDKQKAEQIVKGHNGTVIAPEPSIQDKLASVGLDLDDLKAALGL